MKKIILLCANGMSTSILVNKMVEAAKDKGLDVEIQAHAISKAKDVADDADAILLGPQVRFQLESIRSQFPDKVVESIDMVDYGMINGKKILEDTLSKLN